MTDIFIVNGARTAIGTFGGSLSSFRPAELGALVMKDAFAIDRPRHSSSPASPLGLRSRECSRATLSSAARPSHR